MEKAKKVRVKKPKAPKPPKPIKTEIQLAEEQAARMLRDMNRLQATSNKPIADREVRSGVDIWSDSDFFFSIVFQSAAQKYLFLEFFSKKFGLGIDEVRTGDEKCQILNGLKLAEKLGLNLPSEKSGNFPYPNLELSKLALDGEEF